MIIQTSKAQTSQSTSPCSQNNTNNQLLSKQKKKVKDKSHGGKKNKNEDNAYFTCETTHEEVVELKEDLLKVLQHSPCDFHKTKKILKVFQSKQMTMEILRSSLVGKVISSAQIQLTKLLKNNDELDDAKKVKKCVRICDSIIDHWKNHVFKKTKGLYQYETNQSPDKTQAQNDQKHTRMSQEENKSNEKDLQVDEFSIVQKSQKKRQIYEDSNDINRTLAELKEASTPVQQSLEDYRKVEEDSEDSNVIKVVGFNQSQVGHLRQLLPKGPIQYRESMRQKFFDIFSKVQYESHLWDPNTLVHQLPKISIHIEQSLQKAFPVPRDYATKARSLIFNLGDQKNLNLRLRVLQGTISPSDLIKADAKQLASNDLKTEREKIQLDDLNSRRTDWQQEKMKERMADGKTQGFFTCHKCHSKKTSFYQMQTRGADEPMTNFVHCLKCGKRWRC